MVKVRVKELKGGRRIPLLLVLLPLLGTRAPAVNGPMQVLMMEPTGVMMGIFDEV
jgi:hypothetical protein